MPFGPYILWPERLTKSACEARSSDVHRAGRLSRIAVKHDAVRTQQLCNRGDILNRSDLVIDSHDRRHEDGFVEHGLQHIEPDEALAVDRNGLHDEPFTLFEGAGCGKDALVLNGAYQDATPARRRPPCQAKKGEVVRLGGPGGEDHLVRIRPDQSRDRCR